MVFSTEGFFRRWTGGSLGILIRAICSGFLGGWLCAAVFLFTKTEFSILSEQAPIVVLISIFYFLANIGLPVLVVGVIFHSILVLAKASNWIAYVASGAISGLIGLIALKKIFGLDVSVFEYRQMYSLEVCTLAGALCALSFWLSLRPDRAPRPPKARIYVTHRTHDLGE